MANTAIKDDLMTPEVIADPHGYYRMLRENDRIHWNEKMERLGAYRL